LKINKRNIKKIIIYDRWYVFFLSLILFFILIDISIDNSEITIVSIDNSLRQFDGYYKDTVIRNDIINMNITNEYLPILNINIKNIGERSTIIKNVFLLIYKYENVNKTTLIEERKNIEISNNYAYIIIPTEYIKYNQTRIYVMPFKINSGINITLRKGETQTMSIIVDYNCYECKRILLTLNFEYEDKIISSQPLWILVMKNWQ